MFDFSWGEVMLIGGVALIFIPPKDLPKTLRTVGQMTTKVRRMASEFHGQLNEALREAELDDVRREVQDLNRQVASATATAFNPIQKIRDELKSAVDAPPTAVTMPTSSPAVTESTLSVAAHEAHPGLAAGGLDPFATATEPALAVPSEGEHAVAVEEAGPVPQVEAVAHPSHPAPAPPPPEMLETAGPGLETGMETPHSQPKSAGA